MNILVVYHGEGCIDGFTSAWLATVAAERAGHEPPDLFPLTYADGQEQVLQQRIVDKWKQQLSYDIIYILDISLSLQCLETLTKTTKANIIMLDHHRTAFNRYVPDEPRTDNENQLLSLYDGQIQIALNNTMSGAGMAHMYFFPHEQAPLLVQHVQDRDIWRFDMQHTKAVHQYLKAQDMYIAGWSDINAMMSHDEGYRDVVREGQRLLTEWEAKIDSICEYSEWVTLQGKTGLMVRCDHQYASDAGHLLSKISGSFGLTYCTDKADPDRKNLRVSLRSERNFDVEVMAKVYGGGGHKNAAGFVIEEYKLFSGELA